MRPKLYIFDLDGTLYRGSETMPHAPEVLKALREEGAQIRFLTNNSSRHRDQLMLKLLDVGIQVERKEIYSSAYGAAKFLPTEGIQKVFVVGETGLRLELEDAGIEVEGKEPQAVLAGICRTFTYDWMNQALQHLLNGAKFFATNLDRTYPLEKGRLEPGAGAIVASIAACSGLSPTVIGKPEPFLIELILKESEIYPSEAMVVGDRLETDIEAGIRAQCPTFLVLSGVTQHAPDGQFAGNDLRPLLD